MTFPRILLKVLRRDPWHAGIVLLGMMVSSLGQVVTLGSAYPILEFFSRGSSDHALTRHIRGVLGFFGVRPTLGGFLLVFVSSGMLYAAVSAFFDAYQKRYLRIEEQRLRRSFAQAMFAADWAYLRSLVYGETVNILTREVDYYCKAVIKQSLMVLSSTIQIFALTGLALWIHWKFSLAAFSIFGAGAMLFIPLFYLSNRMGKVRVKTSNALTSSLLCFLRASKTIKAGSLETYAAGSLFPLIDRFARVYFELGLVEVAQARVNDVLGYVYVASLTYVGHALFRLDLAALMVLMVVFFRLMSPIRTAIDAYNLTVASMPSVEIVTENLRRAQANGTRSGGIPFKPPVRTIEYRGVRYSHPGLHRPLLENFSLKVSRGEFCLIAGHTGSGKTTMLDLLLGLYSPQSGDILINGLSLEALDLASWHSCVGYLSQDPVIFEGTVRSNLLWGSMENCPDEALRQVLCRAQLESLLKDPRGLDQEVLESGNNLSGGEKQRLALARVLLRNPEVLVFDEPTSALDKDTEQEIIDILSGLKGQVTAFIVSHQPRFRSICDRIVELGVAPEPTVV